MKKLDATVEKHAHTLTDQMAGTMRSGSDADKLATAIGDEKCALARWNDLKSRQAKR